MHPRQLVEATPAIRSSGIFCISAQMKFVANLIASDNFTITPLES